MPRRRHQKLDAAWRDESVALLIDLHRDANRPRLTTADCEERHAGARSADPAAWPRCVRCETRSQSIIVVIGLPCEACADVESERLQRLFHPYRRALPDAPRAA